MTCMPLLMCVAVDGVVDSVAVVVDVVDIDVHVYGGVVGVVEYD